MDIKKEQIIILEYTIMPSKKNLWKEVKSKQNPKYNN